MSTAENTELTKEYITQSLFRLMEEKSYESISVTDIVRKAGVGRATYYRYFKTKDEIIREYFVQKTREFDVLNKTAPVCTDDYYESVFLAFSQLKKEKSAFRRLIEAHMEWLYLDYLNTALLKKFKDENLSGFRYTSAFIAGCLFNVSIEWVRNDCAESVKTMADHFLALLLSRDAQSIRKGETQ